MATDAGALPHRHRSANRPDIQFRPCQPTPRSRSSPCARTAEDLFQSSNRINARWRSDSSKLSEHLDEFAWCCIGRSHHARRLCVSPQGWKPIRTLREIFASKPEPGRGDAPKRQVVSPGRELLLSTARGTNCRGPLHLPSRLATRAAVTLRAESRFASWV